VRRTITAPVDDRRFTDTETFFTPGETAFFFVATGRVFGVFLPRVATEPFFRGNAIINVYRISKI
jgi:hypothetical protein